jgi:hypothetical protein
MDISKNSAYPSLPIATRLPTGKIRMEKDDGFRSDDSHSRVRLVGAIKDRVFRDALIQLLQSLAHAHR